MVVAALLGVATKFYTATFAVIYRGKGSQGGVFLAGAFLRLRSLHGC